MVNSEKNSACALWDVVGGNSIKNIYDLPFGMM